MTDIEQRLKGIKSTDLLDKCKTFLGNGWSEVNESNFEFNVLTFGFGNRLFLCGVKENTVIPSPEKVLVRLYGGNLLDKNLPSRVVTEASECIVFYALAERGWAPKLFGVFEGGRIEEYIPCRFFTIDEFCDDPDISAAMSRSMARYHSLLNLPIPKVDKDWPSFWREHHAKHL